MQKTTVSKILKMDTTYEYKWEGSYVYDEEAYAEDPTEGVYNYTVVTDEITRDILRTLYGGRTYCDFDDDSEDVSDLLDSFKENWEVWIASRDAEIAPLMYALSLKYNPIENYHSNEVKNGTIADNTSQTLEFTNRKDVTKDDSYVEHSFTDYKETEKVDEETTKSYGTGNDAYKETMSYGEAIHTDKTSADDATDFVNQAQGIDALHSDNKTFSGTITDSRKTGQSGNTKEIAGSWKDAHGIPQDGSGHVFEKQGVETTRNGGSKTDNYTLERYGNIGVTTTQKMLESSYELAKRSVVYLMLKEFIELYTYVSMEVE